MTIYSTEIKIKIYNIINNICTHERDNLHNAVIEDTVR